jgi:hypothetical protein
VIDMDYDVVLLFICPGIIFCALAAVMMLPVSEDGLTAQAVEHCPNGWDVNRYCTEGIYNYSCRDDGKNYTYVC